MAEVSLDLIPSGVPELDNILGGGLRPGRLYFVEGATGTGKTTLGMQFVLEGARCGERSLLVSLAETADELALIADSHGWSLDGVAVRDLAEPTDSIRSTALFDLSEAELDTRVQALLTEMETLRPQRLVVDTLSALRAFSVQPGAFRHHVELFRSKTNQLGCTTIVVDDLAGEHEMHPRSLAWGIIRLEQWVADYGATRRRLWVPKLRGQPYAGGYHDLRIRTGGLTLFPRLDTRTAAEPYEHATVSSGIAAIDDLLKGGLERGTSAGLVGPPGCGKSTLACAFALSAAARGERIAFYLFDESIETFRLRALGQGLAVDAHLDADLLALRRVNPAELSPGEFASELAAEVEVRGTRLIVIDSLNGYLQAMPEERLLSLHVHGLLSYLSANGVLTLLTLAQPSPFSHLEGLAVDLSYLTDTVIAQRYFEAYGAIRYALSVVKKRYGNHERTIREYQIGSGGISVGEPLADFRGVLTGMPEYVGDKRPLLSET